MYPIKEKSDSQYVYIGLLRLFVKAEKKLTKYSVWVRRKDPGSKKGRRDPTEPGRRGSSGRYPKGKKESWRPRLLGSKPM